jgi:hypothetical protein
MLVVTQKSNTDKRLFEAYKAQVKTQGPKSDQILSQKNEISTL